MSKASEAHIMVRVKDRVRDKATQHWTSMVQKCGGKASEGYAPEPLGVTGENLEAFQGYKCQFDEAPYTYTLLCAPAFSGKKKGAAGKFSV